MALLDQVVRAELSQYLAKAEELIEEARNGRMFILVDDEDRENDFLTHMLGHRPSQRFRTLRVGEKWIVPEL